MLQEISDPTKADRDFQRAVEALHTGQWTPAIHQTPTADEPALQALKHVQHELSTNSNGTLLLKGSQIILPATLEQRVLTLAHEGHQSVVKTKQLLGKSVVPWSRPQGGADSQKLHTMPSLHPREITWTRPDVKAADPTVVWS